MSVDFFNDYGQCCEEMCCNHKQILIQFLLFSVVFGRDFWELRGHPSSALEAAMAGEWHSAFPHSPPGWQPESPRTN